MVKLIKIIKNKIVDSGREYLQILLLVISFMFPIFVNMSEIIRTILGGQNPNLDNAKYYYLMLSGNNVIGLLFVLYILFNFIRKANKETILNKGNIYHNHTYAWYWFCSKILGYDKCNLVLVPIQMQFKLVVRDTFKEYPFFENMFLNEDGRQVQMTKKSVDNHCNEFTLIIEDTYPIKEKQIPEKYLNMPLIKLTRSCNTVGKRVYSEKFIDTIVQEIRLLPEDSIINIFATTNPKNTYEIAKKGLFLAERSNIIMVNVFQQEGSGERLFKDKPYTVINRK